jgi:hypothetical protein
VGRGCHTVRVARVVAVLVLPLVVALAACGGGDDGSTTGAEPETVTEVVTAPPATEPTTTAAAEADCSPDAFLPVLKDSFDGTAPKLEIVEAKVERCRNGYAQVFAVPNSDVCKPGKGFCYETEQVFLVFEDGAWTIATSGTGIACGFETHPDAQLIEICRGLGYPDLVTPAFQMPSKNIGCLLGGGFLRCDILSGLNPEPDTGCELDWTGIVLGRTGPAEPQCAGDTVYDRNAPVLAYGSTWRRSGFACESSESGLRCTNPAGESFKLAREGWTVD